MATKQKTNLLNRDEQIKLTYNSFLEEYKSIREEIVFNIDSSRQSLNLTFVATAALITAATFIFQAKLEILFLVAPLLFYIIFWTQIRSIFFQNKLGDYLRTSVIPNLRKSIDDLAPGNEPKIAEVMDWESQWRSRYRSYLITPATIAVSYAPIWVALLSFIAFFTIFPPLSITGIEWGLIFLNIICLVYSGCLAVWTGLRIYKSP